MRKLISDLYRVATTFLGWVVFVSLALVWGILLIPPTLLLSRIWPGLREHFHDLTSRALWLYIKSLAVMRVRVEGTEFRLEGSRVLVANHQSWLDPIILIGLEPRVRGPARAHMFRVPVIRSFLKLAGFFDADVGVLPSRAALHGAATTTLERGGSLLFFPEGTRSRDGEIGPFFRGAFRSAVDHDLPIQPVVIEGLDQVLPPGRLICKSPGRHLVRVRYLPPLMPPYEKGFRRDVVRGLAECVRGKLVEELARLRAERG